MGNPYFQFKQFTVRHELCAMKVGLDGVLLGTWADTDGCDRMLDVGCGSGLIALMLAQRAPEAHIDAIDIEESAVRQTEANIAASPWSGRVAAIHAPLQTYAETCTHRYGLIVSNPPFFNNSLKTPSHERTLARHTDTLPHDALIRHATRLLAPGGRLCLILPVAEGERCIGLALLEGLHCTRRTEVHPKPGAPAKRMLLELGHDTGETVHAHLTVETEVRGQYTPEFTTLAKDFYLKL